MVVIAIIAILSAILLPALSGAKKQGLKIQCISNLKQIGIAVQIYVNDHEDFLPGPIWSTARASYDKNSSQELIYYLASYLGSPDPSAKTVISEVFVCPSYRRYAPEISGGLIGRKIWFLNDDVDTNPVNRVRPFGYPDTGSGEIAPMKLTAFDQNAPPSSVFALCDLDQYVPGLSATAIGAPWWDLTPEKPVHGTIRNHLFFDWHVESVRW